MKLCDFGTCIPVYKSKNEKREIGTLLTMAPEVFNHHTATLKSDMWSIGCVFYNILFG